MPYPPTPTNTWDITQPPDTQLLSQGALDLRNVHVDVMQRMAQLSGTLANRPAPETVNATWGGSGFGLTYFATDTKQIFQWTGAAWVELGYSLPSVGVGVFSPSVTGDYIPIWRAPFACTATSVKALCVGGTSVVYTIGNMAHGDIVTGITVNASSSAADYTDAGALATTGFLVGDRVGVKIVTVNGGVNSFSVQVNFTRP